MLSTVSSQLQPSEGGEDDDDAGVVRFVCRRPTVVGR